MNESALFASNTPRTQTLAVVAGREFIPAGVEGNQPACGPNDAIGNSQRGAHLHPSTETSGIGIGCELACFVVRRRERRKQSSHDRQKRPRRVPSYRKGLRSVVGVTGSEGDRVGLGRHLAGVVDAMRQRRSKPTTTPDPHLRSSFPLLLQTQRRHTQRRHTQPRRAPPAPIP